MPTTVEQWRYEVWQGSERKLKDVWIDTPWRKGDFNVWAPEVAKQYGGDNLQATLDIRQRVNIQGQDDQSSYD